MILGKINYDTSYFCYLSYHVDVVNIQFFFINRSYTASTFKSDVVKEILKKPLL